MKAGSAMIVMIAAEPVLFADPLFSTRLHLFN